LSITAHLKALLPKLELCYKYGRPVGRFFLLLLLLRCCVVERIGRVNLLVDDKKTNSVLTPFVDRRHRNCSVWSVVSNKI